MKLVLFDIDGTLIDSGGAGVRALNYAFRDTFSIDDAFRSISMAGKTDLQIVREAFAAHGITPDGQMPHIMNAYIRRLGEEIGNSRKQLKPGIREALDALSSAGKGLALGLLTGNIEQGARTKLDAFELNRYFPSGAFGSDNEDRNLLLPVARSRFERLRETTIDYKDCIIIGDTPRDVYCAKPYGAFCIAVATGPYHAAALEQAGADRVFETLENTEELIKVIGKSK